MATAEYVWSSVKKICPLGTAGVPAAIPGSGRKAENSGARKKAGGFFGVLGYFFHKEKKESSELFAHYLDLSQKNPQNANFHLKVAEIYQKQGEEEKAIARYLQAAGIFARDQFFPQAMAIYKHVLSLNPHLVQVHLKMADIYRKTGFWADAISQYKIVIRHYERWGKKERIPDILKLMKEIESQRAGGEKKTQTSNDSPKATEDKFTTLPLSAPNMALAPTSPQQEASAQEKKEANDLLFDLGARLTTDEPVELKGINEISTDKLSGFEEIFKELQETVIPSEAYPNFNYHMGVACREMGFNDGAIEQLQIAMEKGQKPVESARLLSKCFREKGWFHEAQKYFEKAMQMEIDSHKPAPGFKSEMVIVHA